MIAQGMSGAEEVPRTLKLPRARAVPAHEVRDAHDLRDATDRSLVAAVASGDEAAMRTLVERHGPAVLAAARRVLADGGRADEAAQDTFLVLWRKPGSYDPSRGGLRSWLCAVARRRAVDVVRKEEVHDRYRVHLAPPETIDDGDRIVERAGVMAELARLSPLQREAIFLAYYEGLTYREVARRLGIPEGTAKTRLRDGLARLRAGLGAVSI